MTDVYLHHLLQHQAPTLTTFVLKIQVLRFVRIDHVFLPKRSFSVLAVKDPKRSYRDYYVVNGNDRKSPPAIYSAGGTQYVYTSKYGEETITSLGVVQQDVSIKVSSWDDVHFVKHFWPRFLSM